MLNKTKVPATAGSHRVLHSPVNTVSLSERDASKMREVEQFITHNFLNITSLSDLARRTGVNTFQLKHSFKMYFGITAFEYAWGLRMAYAKTLLDDPSLSIKEIAKIAGYRSQPNFTAGFKKWFGTPPIAFKRIARKDRINPSGVE